MKQRTFFLIAACLVLMVTFKTYTTDFYFHDDFRFWEGQIEGESDLGIIKYYHILGRPFLACWIYLISLIFNYTANLQLQRLLVVLAIIGSASLLYKVLSHKKYENIPANVRLFTALGVCVLPTFYSAPIWIICSGAPFASIFALLANIYFDRYTDHQGRYRLNLIESFMLLCLSYLMYQPAAAIFLVPYILLAVFHCGKPVDPKIIRGFLKVIFLFIGVSLYYLLIIKFVKTPWSTFEPGPLGPIVTAHDPMQKLKLLYQEIIPLSLAFLPVYREYCWIAVTMLTGVCGFLYIWRCAAHQRSIFCIQRIFWIILVLSISLILLNCVNLAANGPTVQWRTISANQILFFSLFVWGICFVLDTQSRSFHRIVLILLMLLAGFTGRAMVDRTVGAWQAQLETMQEAFNDYLNSHGHVPQHIHVIFSSEEIPKGYDVPPLTLYAGYEEPRPWANRVISKYFRINSKSWVYDGTKKYFGSIRPQQAKIKITYSHSPDQVKLEPSQLVIDLTDADKNWHGIPKIGQW